MSQTSTHHWLRQSIRALPSVRAVHLLGEDPADLLIRTWVGMSVKVYLLDGVPNLRVLKRVLQENTRNYQGTMLIAHHHLMPPDKTRLMPEDWMHALHELNSERIYTFSPGEESLGQVHFDYLASKTEREAWHGDPVQFKHLRVLNVSAKFWPIRGNYMMADFGQNPYWKTSEQRAERLRQRWHNRRQHAGANFVWGQYDAGGHVGGADDASLYKAYVGELERCYAVLGVSMSAPKDDVKAAFRKLARDFHPDVSNLDKAEAEARFREINAAWETIKAKKRWS